MGLGGTRGIVLVSTNLRCDLQAAMVVERVKEREFYRQVTGQQYAREFGERVSARRRGYKFEEQLYKSDAHALRHAVGPMYGLDPDYMSVRNFAEEVPGPPGELHAIRLQRTRRVLGDLAAGWQVPQLLIQPQLRLMLGELPQLKAFVTPDFMVLDPIARIYVPGELKSFIVRSGVAAPDDLDRTRRQVAVQILALRAEAGRVGIQQTSVRERALFVFATPYGLKPADPVEEVQLGSEVQQVRRAIAAIERVKTKLREQRAADSAPLHLLVDELPINYQERCAGSCVMADFCKESVTDRAVVLGDDAAQLLGRDMRLDRVLALLGGALPETDGERAVLPYLLDAAAALRLGVARRRTA